MRRKKTGEASLPPSPVGARRGGETIAPEDVVMEDAGPGAGASARASGGDAVADAKAEKIAKLR